LAKAVTLVTEFAPGLEAEQTFTNNYKAAGGQIAETIRVPLRNPGFAPFLQRVKEAAPQALFVFVPSPQAATCNLSSAASTRPALRWSAPAT
jgi:branched-chain amino acid transport system substrate-binding protein